MELGRFLDGLCDDADVHQHARLRALEMQIDLALDSLVKFNRCDVRVSARKLRFFVETFVDLTQVNSQAVAGLYSALDDISANVGLFGHPGCEDRRESARIQRNVFGTFISARWETCACVVRNSSEQGVCLLVEDAKLLSKRFRLAGFGKGFAIRAEQMWANGNEVGARIVGVEPAGSSEFG